MHPGRNVYVVDVPRPAVGDTVRTNRPGSLLNGRRAEVRESFRQRPSGIVFYRLRIDGTDWWFEEKEVLL